MQWIDPVLCVVLHAAKSRIVETLMMGEALVGLSILWFVKHVVAKVTTAGE